MLFHITSFAQTYGKQVKHENENEIRNFAVRNCVCINSLMVFNSEHIVLKTSCCT